MALSMNVNYLHDEGITSINLLHPSDDHFDFIACNKFYAFKSDIGDNPIGTKLCFLFLGIIKCAKQFDYNFPLDIIPLSCQDYLIHQELLPFSTPFLSLPSPHPPFL